MAIRKSQPGPEGDNLESIAQELLGVHLTGADSLEDEVEIDGLSLDDLGFGLPEVPEVSAPAVQASALPASGEEDERHAELRALLSGGKKSEAGVPEVDEVPPRRPAPVWAFDDSDDDFGAGLLSETQASLVQTPAEPITDAEIFDEDELADEEDEEEFEVGGEADDFGADILEERPRKRKAPRAEKRRSRKPERADAPVKSREPEIEDVEEASEKSVKDDPYWDALENWDWNEGGSGSRRAKHSGSAGEQREEPARGSRRGRKFDKRGKGRPRSAEREPVAEIQDADDEILSVEHEVIQEERESQGPKSGRGRRSRGRRGRAGDERTVETGSREGSREQSRPARRPERVQPVVDEDEFEDDFGMGVLESPAPVEEFDEVEAEDEGRTKSGRRGRNRRRRGRRGAEAEMASESTRRVSNRDDSDEDLIEEDVLFDDSLAEAGDDFGAGVISEEPRARRRPPRQEKAVRPPAEGGRRPHRESQAPTREVSRRERQPVPQVQERVVDSEDDRYKGIPSWIEAIGLLARKPPAVRSSGDDQRQRSRGGRRRGGSSGGRPRR